MDLPRFVYPLLRALSLPGGVRWRLARLVNARFLLGVAGVITDDQGRLLLFEHTYRKHFPWGLPGGWMESGESPLAALEREVYEESTLRVRAERLLLVGTTPDRPKLEFVVAARVVSGTFAPSPEISRHGWFAPADYPPLAVFHRAILAQLARPAPGVGWYTTPWSP